MERTISILALILMISTGNAYSAAPVRGKVVFVGTHGNGDVFVQLDQGAVINEPGCLVIARFDVSATNNASKYILPIASLAIEQDKFVRVATKGCYIGNPTLDDSRNTWFILDN